MEKEYFILGLEIPFMDIFVMEFKKAVKISVLKLFEMQKQKFLSVPAITRPNVTIETLEEGVKYVQNFVQKQNL